MAEAVRQYSAQGYTWLKFYLSPFENVIDQTEAMQAVAPPGFKVHYDFTMHGTDDHMIELLHKLARYPIAGCFEDVLPAQDLPGYIELRKRSPLPVVLHHCPLGATYKVLMGATDVYMLGHAHRGRDPPRGIVRRPWYPLHAAERGGQHHPGHDLSHDGRLSLGKLPFLQRL